MKRVLILEDSPDRVAWFRHKLPDAILDITDQTGQAIRWLKEHTYDLIFLDHDLDDKHYQMTTVGAAEALERTGFDVAQFLADNPDCQKSCRVIIHSLNPWGSARMCDVMRLDGDRDSLQIPYLTLRQLVGDLFNL